jgi:sulfur-oxidizing protein SoxA
MKKTLIALTALGLVCGMAASIADTTPEEDREIYQDYFKKRFPNVPVEDFANGAYALDPIGRENWEAIEEFPPYETAIDSGKDLWETPFANGKT